MLPKKVLLLGATSAMAIAVARKLAAAGASFYLLARSEAKLNAVACDLETRGAKEVFAQVMDLDDSRGHPTMLAAAAEEPRSYRSRTHCPWHSRRPRGGAG